MPDDPQNKHRGFRRVKIGGRHRPVKLGYNAMCTFCDMEDMPLAEAQQLDEETTKPGHIRSLFYAGLKDGARVAGEEFNASEYDVGEWIFEADAEQMEKIWEAWQFGMADEEDGEADADPLETKSKEEREDPFES
jgi:hypothetical protein